MRARWMHPTELKIRLVESCLNGEGSLKSISEAHDVTHTLLIIWIDKYRRGELTDEIDFVEKGRATEAKDRQTHKLPTVE